MPRVSDKHLLIEWFLETLLRKTKSMVSTVRTALTEGAYGQLELKSLISESVITIRRFQHSVS